MNEIEKLLIDDILSDIPEETEHEFSERYMRLRCRNIKRYEKQTSPKAGLRLSFKIAAMLAAVLLIFTGWNDLHFVNGFAVSRTQMFVQLTPELNEIAPARIQATPTFSALNGGYRTTTYEYSGEAWYDYTLDGKCISLKQFTPRRYNDLRNHLLFSEISGMPMPFSSSRLNGVYIESKWGYTELTTVYNGYVLEMGSYDYTIGELIEIADTITL